MSRYVYGRPRRERSRSSGRLEVAVHLYLKENFMERDFWKVLMLVFCIK